MITALSLLEGDYISFKDSFPGDGDRCIVRFPDGSKLDVVLKLHATGDVSLGFYTDLVIPEGMADLATKQGATMDLLLECEYTIIDRAVKLTKLSYDEFIREMVALGKKL